MLNINQIQLWLGFDEKCLFIKAKMTKCSKKCQHYMHSLESTYPEMQRKHIPKVYEYQLSTIPGSTRLKIDFKHQPDTLLGEV